MNNTKHKLIMTTEKIKQIKQAIKNLEDQLQPLVNKIKERKAKNLKTVLLINGKTSAGKSFVLDVLTDLLKKNSISKSDLALDNYNKGTKFVTTEHAKGNLHINYDHPEYVDLNSAALVIEDWIKEKPAHGSVFDFKSGEPTGKLSEVLPANVLIVEGIFAFDDKFDFVDSKGIHVNLDITTFGSLIRRLMRDLKRTPFTAEEILSYYFKFVMPMFEQHIEPKIEKADFKITNEMNPVVESHNTDNYGIQRKYKLTGAEKLGLLQDLLAKAEQVDTYYQSKEKDLIASGESLRKRQIGSTTLLSYKGPRIENETKNIIRPFIEFEISTELSKKLPTMAYASLVIEKDRAIYEYKGIEIAVDRSVTSIKNGSVKSLGNFIELRVNKKTPSNETKLKEIAEELGLIKENVINQTYSELGNN